MLKNFLIVGVGGFAGACARYGITIIAARFLSASFPLGVLIANAVGSFIAGAVLGLTMPSGLRLLFYTGFLGAFTTFSAFSADTLTLYNSGAYAYAAVNVISNFVLSLGGCVLGYQAIKYLAGIYGW